MIVRESLDFERNRDPFDSLGIGVKDKIRKGILGLLRTSRESNGVTRISTINLLHNRDETWLEISDYGSKDFEDVFYSFLSPEYFKDGIYIKVKPRKYAKSFKDDWKVFIKDEYKAFFQDCFDSGGYIVESQNFERANIGIGIRHKIKEAIQKYYDSWGTKPGELSFDIIKANTSNDKIFFGDSNFGMLCPCANNDKFMHKEIIKKAFSEVRYLFRDDWFGVSYLMAGKSDNNFNGLIFAIKPEYNELFKDLDNESQE